MEYTVQKLAALAGVSTRTLRYYDRIGLLPPLRISESGYRIYGAQQVSRLQQILFYRELEFPLREIHRLLSADNFNEKKALEEHRRLLLEKRARLDRLIQTVDKTLQTEKGEIVMSDAEKFEGFKRELVEANEKQYGREIREMYGDGEVDASNAKLMGLTREKYDAMQSLEREVLAVLDEAYAQGDPHSETARRCAALHREWLSYSWSEYSPQAHAGLAEMYASDERFAAYYDRGTPGKAVFLRDAITSYTESL